MKCYGSQYCSKYPDSCHKYCIGYIQLNNVYSLSQMPEKYRTDIKLLNPGKDLEAYVYLKAFRLDIVSKVQSGEGIFLFSSNKGNGKTSWVCKIMNHYLRQVALANNLRCRALFVNVPDFLQRLRENMDNPVYEMHEMIRMIKSADMVVWDDIGTENHSDWVRERLYTYINYRESNNLTQLYTSNLGLDVLESEKYLGSRIVSRIYGQCKVIQLIGPDRRGDK